MPWTKAPKDTRQRLDRAAPADNNKRLDANSKRHGLMPAGLIAELEDAGFNGGSGGGSSAVATRFEVSFHANGPFRAGTDVDGRIYIRQAATILGVSLHRITAGSGSSTIVDLNINGTTAFTTQANRPTVTAASGNSASSTAVPDVTGVAAGQYLSMDIDQVETGLPLDAVVVVEMEPV